ncbi:MAG: NAD(P)-dependent oxidoreductase [Candidatus Marinimicrobia bacterium]|nr:NAD(P)-dependent oxidoreductase [Candidatus Neomarinimicrobiota bacterium]
MKILVTGATGFIGRNLVRKLLQKNYYVRCLIRNTSIKPSEFIGKVQWIVGNLSDYTTLIPAIEGIDVVIHLAGVIEANKKSDYFKVNYYGMVNLLEAIKKSGRRGIKFLYVSSLASAGPSNNNSPKKEDSINSPVSNYGRSKLAGEIALLKECDYVNAVIVRPAIVYGPGDKETFSFFKYVKNHLRPVIGFKERYFSLIYLEDLVKLIIQLMERNIESCEIFFASDGKIYTASQLLKQVSKIMNKWTIPIPVPLFLLKFIAIVNTIFSFISGKVPIINIDKYYEIREQYWMCSADKIFSLGFKPSYDLERGLRETYNWYINNGWL